MLLKRIASIEFSVLNPENIRKMSALEVKTPETYDKDGYPMEGGLMDPHLGVINPGLRCKTCGQQMKSCPGHFGHLSLVRPVVHSEFSKKIEELMHVTCQSCGRIALNEEKIAEMRELLKDESIDVAKRIIAKTKKVRKCPYCSGERKEVLLDKPTNFYLEKDRIYPTQIRDWVEKIPDKDLEFFGYNFERIRPEWFVLTALQVPPITIRPSITLESGIKSEDDLTHKLVDIIRINIRLKDNIDAGAPQLIIEDLWDLLQYHVTTYFDNNTAGVPPAKHRSGRALRTLVQRLKGKKGRFRYNLTGKRVNFAARSTISPDPYISINEIGVPEEIAKELTVPEFVTEWNEKFLKKQIKETSKIIYVIRPNGQRKKVTEENRKEIEEEIAPGFKVERTLHDGDIILFNRQPSLHRMSMMAHYARIMPNKTFRMNPTTCVSGDTKVMLESCSQTTIEELEKNWENEHVRNCVIESGEIQRTELSKFWKLTPEEIGKKCIEIRTESGRIVKLTADHPLFSDKGKVNAEELKIGDRLIAKPLDTPLVETASNKEIFSIKKIEAFQFEKTYKKSLLKKIREAGFENITESDCRARIFARLLGHLFGDGTFILKGHAGRAVFRGEVKDLEEMQEDIARLGFTPERIKTTFTTGRITSINGKQAIINGSGNSFEVRSKPFCTLLSVLEAPNGDKVKSRTPIPKWIMDSGKAIKREFLAAYFGSELSTPKQRKKQKSNFITPVFKIAKLNKEHAHEFIKGIETLLGEFDIRIASVYEERGNLRKDGSKSIIFAVKLSTTEQSLSSLYGSIGFVYAGKKEKLAGLAFQYLKFKKKAIEKRQEQYLVVHSLRKRGIKFKQISSSVNISIPMLEKWVYHSKTGGLPSGFISFNDWKKQASQGLGESGLVWEKIESINEIKLPVVFDVTTLSEAHNFFANGLLSGNCKPYNADFDGDEMNLHVPQTEEGKAEARNLMLCSHQAISPRHGGPVIVLDEDQMSGAFTLSLKSTKFEKDEAMKYFYEIGITEIPEPDIEGKYYSGKLVFSQLLPKDLNMDYESYACGLIRKAGLCTNCLKEKCGFDAFVKIKNGMLETGVLDSASFGERRGQLADSLFRNYGPETLEKFYSAMCRLSVLIITRKGMTAGIDEYLPSEKVEELKEEISNEAFEEIGKLVEDFKKGVLEPIPGKSLEESLETKIIVTGMKLKSKLEKQIMREKIEQTLKSENPLYNTSIIVLSKAKGSPANFTNISGFLGQVNVREGRPRRGFKGRLVSINRKSDIGAIAGGFVPHNLFEGLSSRELFYHSMGARQGEVDTSVATKVSGYLYRRLASSLKDLLVHNDETVRTASKNLIQFVYGEDAAFPMKTVRGKNLDVKKIFASMEASKK
jgi:DNA-directed RNA polymerase subunit A'